MSARTQQTILILACIGAGVTLVLTGHGEHAWLPLVGILFLLI